MSINEAATQSDILNSFFNGLRNKSPEIRLQSARELQKYVRFILEFIHLVMLNHWILGSKCYDRDVFRDGGEVMGGHITSVFRACA